MARANASYQNSSAVITYMNHWTIISSVQQFQKMSKSVQILSYGFFWHDVGNMRVNLCAVMADIQYFKICVRFCTMHILQICAVMATTIFKILLFIFLFSYFIILCLFNMMVYKSLRKSKSKKILRIKNN